MGLGFLRRDHDGAFEVGASVGQARALGVRPGDLVRSVGGSALGGLRQEDVSAMLTALKAGSSNGFKIAFSRPQAAAAGEGGGGGGGGAGAAASPRSAVLQQEPAALATDGFHYTVSFSEGPLGLSFQQQDYDDGATTFEVAQATHQAAALGVGAGHRIAFVAGRPVLPSERLTDADVIARIQTARREALQAGRLLLVGRVSRAGEAPSCAAAHSSLAALPMPFDAWFGEGPLGLGFEVSLVWAVRLLHWETFALCACCVCACCACECAGVRTEGARSAFAALPSPRPAAVSRTMQSWLRFQRSILLTAARAAVCQVDDEGCALVGQVLGGAGRPGRRRHGLRGRHSGGGHGPGCDYRPDHAACTSAANRLPAHY
jgi:hypothetical protein